MANRQETRVKKRPKKKGPHPVLKVIGTFFLVGLITCAMLACMAVMYIKVVIMPNVGLELGNFDMNLTSTIYYTDQSGNNKVLRTLHGSENRIWVAYKDIPENLINATVAIEDKRFYQHNGVDWIRTAYGVMSMFTGRDIQGGSTLTQQLIKNLTEEDQVTVKRKIKEIFRAIEFENKYSKKDILEWYLNYIYLGENCNGVYTAAYTYFGKDVSELSLAECASLIGITNNPSLYNPYRNAEGNKNRQTTILYAMADQGYITEEERDAAVAEELQFVRGEGESREFEPYSWYVDAVIDQVINDLMAKDYSAKSAADLVYAGGLEIYSCYNDEVQRSVDSVYQDMSNLNYRSSLDQPLQSAITVVNNKTGQVVALAGGMGEKTESRSFNRATSGTRQPGSSIKPLSVYAPAIEMGEITPNSIQYDKPNSEGWPKNSYNSYKGAISVMEAVRISSNCVAVNVLQNIVTEQKSLQFMRDVFHIELVESRTQNGRVVTDETVAALALGGLTDGVTTYEMASAYSVFPRNGTYIEPVLYTRVVNSEGVEILNNSPEETRVLQEKTAVYITKMLKKVVDSGTGKLAKFNGQVMAGKTGTTDSRKDLWFVGYTPYYTAAVWTGFDISERIPPSANNPSVVLWKKVMSAIHKGYTDIDFAAPTGMITLKVCTASGRLPNSYCPSTEEQSFTPGEEPTQNCGIHGPAKPRPPAFDPGDEATWPTDDPNFKIDDPTTWPGYVPPTTPAPSNPTPIEPTPAEPSPDPTPTPPTPANPV